MVWAPLQNPSQGWERRKNGCLTTECCRIGLECAHRKVHKLECGHLHCSRMDLESKKMMWLEGSMLEYDRRRQRDRHRRYCHHVDSPFDCRRRKDLLCGCRLRQKRRLEYGLRRQNHSDSTLAFLMSCQDKLVLVEISTFV